MSSKKPSSLEIQQLGQALVDAINKPRAGWTQWPLRLEIMDLKSELAAFDPDGREVFRIKTGGLWL